MKIVFLSNYLSPHQVALSDELALRSDYTFLATREMGEERRQLGYPALPRAYLLESWRQEEEALACIRQADVVIAGSAPEGMVRERIRTGKLLFRYSERPLKNGAEPLKFLPRLLRWHWRNPPGKPIYMLCAGGYAAEDFRKFGLFRGRMYQWGYFPERREYPREKEPDTVIWCGRMLDWKRPGDALEAARRLYAEGYRFRLEFLGCGPLEGELRQRAAGLDGLRFLGAKPGEEVSAHMERAGICLVTSGRQEGWGAVVHEAMNAGCAVIVGNQVGAAPCLIRDGDNGLVYGSGNVEELTEKLRFLLDHPEDQARLGRAANGTIAQAWNAQVAAERLIQLAESILAGEESPDLFEEGPCSRV